MHALIFWGFLILLTTILEVALQLLNPEWEIPLIGGSAWLGLAPARPALSFHALKPGSCRRPGIPRCPASGSSPARNRRTPSAHSAKRTSTCSASSLPVWR